MPIFYSTSNRGELDFLIQYKNNIIPLEAKAKINLQAKSLKSFRQKYELKISIIKSDFAASNFLLFQKEVWTEYNLSIYQHFCYIKHLHTK